MSELKESGNGQSNGMPKPESVTIRLPEGLVRPVASPPWARKLGAQRAVESGAAVPAKMAAPGAGSGPASGVGGEQAGVEVGEHEGQAASLMYKLSKRPPGEANEEAMTAMKAEPPPLPKEVGSPWRSVMWRLFLLVLCGVSVALVCWSWYVRLQPVTELHKQRIMEMTRASDEVEVLRRKWTREEIDLVQARHVAARELLFSGQEELKEWNKEAKRISSSMMLDMSMGAERQEPTQLAGLGVVSVGSEMMIRTDVPVGLTNSPYKQALGFLHSVGNSPKRVDMVDFLAVGNSNSLSTARVGLRFWVESGATNVVKGGVVR